MAWAPSSRLRCRLLLALLCGALVPISFSPLSFWPAGIAGPLGLFLLLRDQTVRHSALIGWCFGLGLFGIGSSWVYVSIATYGNVGTVLAFSITLLFVMLMALFTALPCALLQRFLPGWGPWPFAAAWVLGEWLRSWLLTGFPWLYLGYAHIHTPLAGLAPVIGVMGISFVLALTAACLAQAWFCRQPLKNSARALWPALAAWLLALLLWPVSWTHPVGNALQAGIVHGTIPQEIKFDPGARLAHLDYFEQLSEPLWGHDLIIWPETAIAFFYEEVTPLLDLLDRHADAEGSTLISGIFSEPRGQVHNSILALGQGGGLYHKQKLVPFGEYVPLSSLVGPVMQLFDLPMSSIYPGPSEQALLQAGNAQVAPFICYEIVYPDFVRRQARDATLLVTISNDTWFGSSWGPRQHLEMAAMRALENGRYLLRATNHGLSAIVGPRGQILQRSEQYLPTTLSAPVYEMSGRTPFSRWGHWPVVLLSVSLILVAAATRRKTTD